MSSYSFFGAKSESTTDLSVLHCTGRAACLVTGLQERAARFFLGQGRAASEEDDASTRSILDN